MIVSPYQPRPGPGQYEQPTIQRNNKHVRSVFQSRTARFRDDQVDNEEDVTSEDSSKDFIRYTNATLLDPQDGSRSIADSASATEKCPFSSSAPRFPINSTFMNASSLTPGPGSYNSHEVCVY